MSTEIDEGEVLLLTGSDEHRAHVCSPCSKDGRTVSGTSYCRECCNVLCGNCLNQHNRFGAMALHEVKTLDDDVDAGQAVLDNTNLPSLQCGLHRGKLLEMYCENHDEVICIICMTMKHSTCKQTSYLPSVVEEKCKEIDFVEATMRLKEIKSHLINLKENELIKKDEIMMKNESMKKQINDEKQLINEYVNSLESPVLEEIETMTKKMIDSKVASVQRVETIIRNIEKSEKALMARGTNLSDSFIKLKQTRTQITGAEQLLIETKQLLISDVKFRPNKRLSKQLKGIDSLGKLVYRKEQNLPDKILSYKNVDVVSENDKVCPDISGACILTDGSVILVDCKNKSLKKLNERYQFSGDVLKLQSIPWSGCTVNSTTIAVSMWSSKSVLLVWVKGKMEVCTSFSVSGKCSGIFHNDEKLYVCVEGMNVGDKGTVEVYTLMGVRLKVLSHNICLPRSVTILVETIFVADEENVLIEIKNEHTEIHACKDLVETQSLCVGPDDNLFICGMTSNNILSFSTEENIFTEAFLDKTDVKKPQMLCVDHEKSILIVGMENCTFIKVYNLKRAG